MKAVTLLYHDVVPSGNSGASGFPGEDAAIYKLDLESFEQHLDATRSAISRCVTVDDLEITCRFPTLLTFDDGGVSAHDCIADLLEARGWRGHFFVTTNWIGRRGFLTSAQIRDLRRRGHLIGSHSCSHPARMSHCSRPELYREWKDSADILSQILGEPIQLASVPGGYYARPVAEAAAECGMRILFTSEPRTTTQTVNGCLVLGRYMIQRGATPRAAAAIASGRLAPRCRQFVYWNVKKVLKAAGGQKWLQMRKWMLAGSR
jgi:peptidoglycan/xylan/chitin deacetylase (PgdA/CDA1 family)